jgi:hypothetical protein
MKFDFVYFVALVAIIGSGICCPDDIFCQQCLSDNDSQCAKCNNSFYNDDTEKCDVDIGTIIEHCVEYKKEGDKIVCSRCENGFSADDKTNCTACKTEGCAICFHDLCINCKDGIFPNSDGKCDKNNTCKIDNCEICQQDETIKCIECKSGYTVSENTGQCIQSLPNCSTVKDEKSTACSVCNPGFYIKSDGGCQDSKNPIPVSTTNWLLYISISGLVIGVAAGAFCFLKKKNKSDDDSYLIDDKQ